ncbi:hypothetical protein LBMAG42_42150 [Deltaproteobacteria bacterium]|nr:hypothetical protein LBMAG42_42150 [Deltaproteobacteria bacterium]
MIYVDTSALLKRYIEEGDSHRAASILSENPTWITARITLVEVRRNLTRLLAGEDRLAAQAAFAADWQRMHVVELDETTCESAAVVAESTGARSLDAIHIGAAVRACGRGGTFVTFDLKQAQAARAMGLTVRGLPT